MLLEKQSQAIVELLLVQVAKDKVNKKNYIMFIKVSHTPKP